MPEETARDLDQAPARASLGLALGGGGVRGLAHIGVLKQLDRHGLRPDYLAGTSMGGLLAALYACGWPADQLEEEMTRMTRVRQLVRLLDFTDPRRGLLQGNNVRAYLSELIGSDRRIEDLPTPLALVSVDVRTGREVVLRSGSLYDAVMATVSVPSLFPPISIGKYRLVDGGLLNNVPVDVARAMGAQVVVAVDVTPYLPEEAPDEEDALDFMPSRLPSIARDLFLAELIMVSALTRSRLRESPPDLVLNPDIPPAISIFWGFTRAAEAIDAGEEALLQALPNIKKLIGLETAP